MFFVGHDVRTKKGDPLLTRGDDVDLVTLISPGDDSIYLPVWRKRPVCAPKHKQDIEHLVN